MKAVSTLASSAEQPRGSASCFEIETQNSGVEATSEKINRWLSASRRFPVGRIATPARSSKIVSVVM